MSVKDLLADHWYHLDGTHCPTHLAHAETASEGQKWWCTEHQQHLEYRNPNSKLSNGEQRMIGTITEWMNLSDLCRRWQPGSKRDSELRDDWSWADEALEMIGGPHYLRTFQLLLNIKENGIREPILLGHDGIVWDGHHRVIAARLLGIELVPVEVVEREKSVPPCPHCGVSVENETQHWNADADRYYCEHSYE